MKASTPCAVRCLLAVIGAGVCVILVCIALLASAGDWLRAGPAPETADAIVVLAGMPERALYAAELFKAGYAKKIFVSRPLREHSLEILDKLGIAMPKAEDVNAQILTRSGVPSTDILFFGKGSASTWDEARAMADLIQSKPLKLLVVTSPYHVRRASMIFRQTYGPAHIVVGTPYEPFPREWWRSQDAARNVLLELAKITFYLVGGRFTESAQK